MDVCGNLPCISLNMTVYLDVALRIPIVFIPLNRNLIGSGPAFNLSRDCIGKHKFRTCGNDNLPTRPNAYQTTGCNEGPNSDGSLGNCATHLIRSRNTSTQIVGKRIPNNRLRIYGIAILELKSRIGVNRLWRTRVIAAFSYNIILETHRPHMSNNLNA